MSNDKKTDQYCCAPYEPTRFPTRALNSSISYPRYRISRESLKLEVGHLKLEAAHLSSKAGREHGTRVAIERANSRRAARSSLREDDRPRLVGGWMSARREDRQCGDGRGRREQIVSRSSDHDHKLGLRQAPTSWPWTTTTSATKYALCQPYDLVRLAACNTGSSMR